MKQITLGSTGIQTPQNAFGALPVQRVSMDKAVKILHRAYEGGMTFLTPPARTATVKKNGRSFGHMRDKSTSPPRQWQQTRMFLETAGDILSNY